MTLQAAIAAEHAIAPNLADTNWARIVELYGRLLDLEPSATIAVGRCVAISQLSGPAAGLTDLDDVVRLGGLERYPYAFGARAQMLAALGRHHEAAQAWSAAADVARTDAERDYFAAQSRDAGTSRPTRAP
jgi:RNA polymerase sigma-70 factor (ECF subfamily)